jgi:hypothetical protein
MKRIFSIALGLALFSGVGFAQTPAWAQNAPPPTKPRLEDPQYKTIADYEAALDKFIDDYGKWVLSLRPEHAATGDDALRVPNYKTPWILVESIEENPLKLSDTEVMTRAELRARAVGLQPNKYAEPQFLSVTVTIVGAAFSVDVSFHRIADWVTPDGDVPRGMVVTWTRATTGTHGRDKEYVLSAVASLIDEFLNAYLKANQ